VCILYFVDACEIPMSFALNREEFELACESCGSLTIVLPVGSKFDPQEVIKCGRCGSSRGTLLMLRERSLRIDSPFD
jgi:hypothetical protein